MSYHPCVSGCGRFLALRTVTIAASRVWAFSTLRKLLWVVHVLLQKKKGGHDHLGVAYRLRCVKHGGVPLPLPRFSVRPGTRGGAASGGVRGDWGSRWGLPKRSSSPLKRSAAGEVAVGVGWDLCRTGYTARFLRCFPWWPDVDRCIGRALSLRGWRPGCVAPFGCGSVVRARPRDDGYASRATENVGLVWKKKKSTASRCFEAGRVVSRWGSRWFSAPPSGAILPGSAWGAHKIVEGTFHCPKQIL